MRLHLIGPRNFFPKRTFFGEFRFGQIFTFCFPLFLLSLLNFHKTLGGGVGSHGVVGSTRDFGFRDPSSILGGTESESFLILIF